MNKRETVDIVFITAVIIVLAGAFIYVNLPSDEGEEEATDEGTTDEGGSTEEGGDVVETQRVHVGYVMSVQDAAATGCC